MVAVTGNCFETPFGAIPFYLFCGLGLGVAQAVPERMRRGSNVPRLAAVRSLSAPGTPRGPRHEDPSGPQLLSAAGRGRSGLRRRVAPAGKPRTRRRSLHPPQRQHHGHGPAHPGGPNDMEPGHSFDSHRTLPKRTAGGCPFSQHLPLDFASGLLRCSKIGGGCGSRRSKLPITLPRFSIFTGWKGMRAVHWQTVRLAWRKACLLSWEPTCDGRGCGHACGA